MNEIWKKTSVSEIHSVSNLGNIRRDEYDYTDKKGRTFHRKATPVKVYPNSGDGRCYVILNTIHYAFEDIVCEAFIPGYDSETDVVVHIDGDINNCMVDNLEIYNPVGEDYVLMEECNGRYKIDRYGHVKSIKRKVRAVTGQLVVQPERDIQWTTKDSPKPYAVLYDGKEYTSYFIDKLVGKYFLGLDYDFDFKHIDGDIFNCCADNLAPVIVSVPSLPGEIWKDIPDSDGYYQVSNLGRVKGLRRMIEDCNGRKLRVLPEYVCKPQVNSGYYHIYVDYRGERIDKAIHRLVASAFIPNPDNLPEVNHIDGNKLNNKYTNLEWCTRSENRRHAIVTGLSSDNKIIKCVEDDKVFYSIKEASAFYNLDSSALANYIYSNTVPQDAPSGSLNKHFVLVDKSTVCKPASIENDIRSSEIEKKFFRNASKHKSIQKYGLDTNMGNNTPVPVYCVQTNEHFESYSAAGRAFDCSASEIKKSVESGCTVHGHHFCKVGDKFEGSIESLPGEIWKPIPGFEDIAMISNRGRVKTVYRVVELSDGRTRGVPEKLRAIHENQVSLRVDGKTKYINVNRTVQSLFNV